jgi:hypothetical protein
MVAMADEARIVPRKAKGKQHDPRDYLGRYSDSKAIRQHTISSMK